MKTRRQLLMWTSVILALSLVLFDKLRENPASADHLLNTHQSDPSRGDLASIIVPAPFKSEEEFSKKPPSEDQPAEPINKQDENVSELPSSPHTSQVSMHVYSVQENDSLGQIANQYDLDLYTLLSVNKIKNSNLIRPGQSLRIPSQRGILHAVEKNQTLEDIALQYEVTLQSIIDANTIEDADLIYRGTVLFIPNAKISKKLRTNLLGKDTTPRFIRPVQGRISDGFGYRIHPVLHRRALHKGIDIAARHGTSVKAAMSGQVSYSGSMGSYGKLVIINHHNGFETRYAHNSKLKVKKGQHVRRGQIIALVGATGRTKGTHLHFEIRVNGKAVDPLKSLKY